MSHPWRVTPAHARLIQEELRSELILEDRLGPVQRVAGADVGFEWRGTVTRAAIAVLTADRLAFAEGAVARRPTTFPYVPGLLSFREIPALLDALGTLEQPPDLVLCDGQGYAHPRRFGLACHLGVVTGLPTVGVAKTRLIGEYDEPPQQRGAWTPLVDRGEIIGAVLRTRVGVKPLFVSCGHRISLPTAIEYVMACTPRYRLPETTRHAHRLASG